MNLVDSHVHLWQPSLFRMAWLDGLPAINRPFLPADLHAHAAPHHIEAYVYEEVDVAPHYALEEARWANALADADPRLRGIVAHAPVEYGAQCQRFLELLTAVGPRIKGVRRLIQSIADADAALNARFVDGVRLLARFGLSFDLCIRHEQLPAVLRLVRDCPDTRFVLDHIGKPDIGAGVLDPWRAHIRELAALPNVACKMSGMATETGGGSWTIDQLRPYALHIIDCFGMQRVMYGGDWPVLLNASTYPRWVDALSAITADFTPAERDALFRSNALRIYSL